MWQQTQVGSVLMLRGYGYTVIFALTTKRDVEEDTVSMPQWLAKESNMVIADACDMIHERVWTLTMIYCYVIMNVDLE